MNRTLVAPMQAFMASSRAHASAVAATTTASATTTSRTAAHGHWCAGQVSTTSFMDMNSKKTTKRTARHLGSAAT
ncbi:MAG: hypothetical protein ACO3AV_03865 [Ilumatobacteraceae bacterium]